MGEHERAIEHGHQILRLNPRDSRSYDTYHMLGVACFVAKAICRGHSVGRCVRSMTSLR